MKKFLAVSVFAMKAAVAIGLIALFFWHAPDPRAMGAERAVCPICAMVWFIR